MEGIHYYLGKICFGTYHRNLVDRIRNRTGRLFYTTCPDYTSMLAAMALTDKGVDVGEPLQISVTSNISNGVVTGVDPQAAYNFLKECDPTLKLIEDLPVKDLYASTHNYVTSDYLKMKAKIGFILFCLELHFYCGFLFYSLRTIPANISSFFI